jgi:hypothetical protein
VNESGNTDALVLATVDQHGTLRTLKRVSLHGGISLNQWYRVTMQVGVSGTTASVTGQVFRHLDPADPHSGVGSQVGATLTFTGPRPDGVDATGQAGLIAAAVSAAVDASVANFSMSP